MDGWMELSSGKLDILMNVIRGSCQIAKMPNNERAVHYVANARKLTSGDRRSAGRHFRSGQQPTCYLTRKRS